MHHPIEQTAGPGDLPLPPGKYRNGARTKRPTQKAHD